MDWVLKHRADFGQNFEWPRKNRMHSTWVQNHLPKKSCTHSQTFPEFLGRNRNYLRRNKKIVGDNLKNVPRNRTNDESLFMKQAVGLYEHAPDYKKTCKISEKSPQNLCFQALWESHNSQPLFLNPNLALNGEVGIVKISILQWQRVRNIYCCFCPNRSLVRERR